MFKRDWFAKGFLNRLPLLILMMGYMTLYFPINRYLMDKGGWVADIEAIDGNMPLIPVFVVVYIAGLVLLSWLPLIATLTLPRELYQEYVVGLLVAMTIGFSIWLLIPAYVEKETLTQDGFFVDLLRQFHTGDDTTGVHNAIPSSHVYYVTIAMVYFIQWKRSLIIPFIVFAVLNALSTMFTLQHYFLDVLAGWVTVFVAYEVAHHWVVPFIRKHEAKNGIPNLQLAKE